MGKIVCIIGNKGGTGKTTLAHMIAHGIGLMGHYAVCVLTDTERDRLSKEGRRYLPFDARSADNLAKVVTTLNHVENWLGVVDGGGNRPAMDRKLADLADVVLLPFRDSHEDIRTVIRDLDRFPNAWALPSQWPTNTWAQGSALRGVTEMMSAYGTRILAPVWALASSKLLLQDRVPERLPAPLNNAAREIAGRVLALLGATIDPDRVVPPGSCDAADDEAAAGDGARPVAPPHAMHA